jgi:hypothetical protein
MLPVCSSFEDDPSERGDLMNALLNEQAEAKPPVLLGRYY